MPSAAPRVRSFRGGRWIYPCGILHLSRPQYLAVGAVAAHLRSRQHDFETEVLLDLLPHSLQRLSKELLDSAATQADHVRMLLLEPGLVIMLVAFVVH